ncbi:hypothetical protein JCM6882_009032 [Rhodosporidiobolus microsporus]
MLRSISSRAARGCVQPLSRACCNTPTLRPTAPRPSHFRSFSAAPQPSTAPPAPTPGKRLPRILEEVKSKTEITLELPTGGRTTLSYMWLRDHCREERSFHPKTRQRLVDTWKIPKDIAPESIKMTDEGMVVNWPKTSTESAYESFYPWSFIVKHSYKPPLLRKTEARAGGTSRKIHWTKKIAKNPPTIEYARVMESEEGVFEWLRLIDIYGFSLVSGIPPTPEATEELIRRIAFIRETHYGGFWDFTANLEHGDLAYSDVRLEAHTDTTYFTDPCGLQLFHLLSPTSTHTGGHNLLVDGFRAAHLLRSRDKKAYDLLSTLAVPAHASGSGSASHPSGVNMRPLRSFPIFNHDEHGELVMVRWNGDDRGALGGQQFMGFLVEKWYKAVRSWETILRSDEAQLWTKMEPGTAVIFDNLRVLHGRSAFTGTRRLCGAYISGDDFRSRLVGLEKQFGSVEKLSGYQLQRAAVDEAVKRVGLEKADTGKIGEKRREAWAEYL